VRILSRDFRRKFSSRNVVPKLKEAEVTFRATKRKLEALREMRPERKQLIACDGCNSDAASLHCHNCTANLCAKCDGENHTTSLLKKHNRSVLFSPPAAVVKETLTLEAPSVKKAEAKSGAAVTTASGSSASKSKSTIETPDGESKVTTNFCSNGSMC